MTASSNRGGTPNQHPHHHRHNQHPQLRLPLSHHGLPRAPTSPSSSFSSRSNRYEALSNAHSSASSSTTTTPTFFMPHAGPKHQHNASIASSSSASTQINASTTAAHADASQRAAASFFRYSRTGDAPPSPPMTPFSPSAFPSEASTPMVLSPALPPHSAASDDSVAQCCAHCRRCGGSVSVSAAAGSQQMRSRSVEDVPSPVRRHASTRSLTHAESSVSSSAAAAAASVDPPLVSAATQVKRAQPERSHSQEGSKGADRGRLAARGPDGPDASTRVGDESKTNQGIAAASAPAPSPPLYAPPPSTSSSSSFSRMGKRIKAALGGPKKGAAAAAAAAAAPSGVRHTGADGAAGRKMAKRRERERERDALVEVEEVGDVHWTEM